MTPAIWKDSGRPNENDNLLLRLDFAFINPKKSQRSKSQSLLLVSVQKCTCTFCLLCATVLLIKKDLLFDNFNSFYCYPFRYAATTSFHQMADRPRNLEKREKKRLVEAKTASHGVKANCCYEPKIDGKRPNIMQIAEMKSEKTLILEIERRESQQSDKHPLFPHPLEMDRDTSTDDNGARLRASITI